jgi:hypothetical protein
VINGRKWDTFINLKVFDEMPHKKRVNWEYKRVNWEIFLKGLAIN